MNVSTVDDVLRLLIKRLERRAPLTTADHDALAALPVEIKTYSAHSYLIREGERVKTAKLIVDGLAYRHKVTMEGARQIVSLHMAGDFIDLEGSLLRVADHNVQAIASCTVAQFPRNAIVSLIKERGRVAHAMWIDTLIDASIHREWVVNVGRRDARAAMCHFLCEHGTRLKAAGLSESAAFQLPMTQEQIADVLGITPVHVNRVLRDLNMEGVVIRHKRYIEVPDWTRLKKIAGFNELYLHLDQATAA